MNYRNDIDDQNWRASATRKCRSTFAPSEPFASTPYSGPPSTPTGNWVRGSYGANAGSGYAGPDTRRELAVVWCAGRWRRPGWQLRQRRRDVRQLRRRHCDAVGSGRDVQHRHGQRTASPAQSRPTRAASGRWASSAPATPAAMPSVTAVLRTIPAAAPMTLPGASTVRTLPWVAGTAAGARARLAPLTSGGVNTLMGDGSVRFVRNTIDQRTWYMMISRNDGQTYSN